MKEHRQFNVINCNFTLAAILCLLSQTGMSVTFCTVQLRCEWSSKKNKKKNNHGAKGRVEQGFAAVAVVLKGQLPEKGKEGSVGTEGGGENTLEPDVHFKNRWLKRGGDQKSFKVVECVHFG